MSNVRGGIDHAWAERTARPLAEVAARWADAMRPIQAQIEALSRRMAAEYPRVLAAAEQLGRKGWTVPMWGTPRIIVHVAEDLTNDQVDAYFAQEYRGPRSKVSQRLLRDVERAPLLQPWESIVHQATAAYRRRHSLVVVPALLPVLEGALAAAAGYFEKGPDPRKHARLLASSQDGSVRQLVLASLNGFVDEVYSSLSFGSIHTGRLNRHWILHGRAGQWTDTDALRVLHALSSLSNVLTKRLAA